MLPIVLALAAASVALCLVMGLTLVRSLKRSSIHAQPEFVVARTIDASPGLVAAKTFDPAAAVDDLVALGYRPSGSMRFELPSHTAIFSLLLSPTGDAFAAVTPLHIAVCSDFGGKIVETTSGGAGVSMPFQLSHTTTATVSDLVASHDATIARVAELTGQQPHRLTQDSIMTVALGIERCSLATFSPIRQLASPVVSLARRFESSGGPSDRAIERWAGRPDRWEPIAS